MPYMVIHLYIDILDVYRSKILFPHLNLIDISSGKTPAASSASKQKLRESAHPEQPDSMPSILHPKQEFKLENG